MLRVFHFTETAFAELHASQLLNRPNTGFPLVKLKSSARDTAGNLADSSGILLLESCEMEATLTAVESHLVHLPPLREWEQPKRLRAWSGCSVIDDFGMGARHLRLTQCHGRKCGKNNMNRVVVIVVAG